MNRTAVLTVFITFFTLVLLVPTETFAQEVPVAYNSANASTYQRTYRDDVTDLPRTGPTVPPTVTTITTPETDQLPRTGAREVVWLSTITLLIFGTVFKKFGRASLLCSSANSAWYDRQLRKNI